MVPGVAVVSASADRRSDSTDHQTHLIADNYATHKHTKVQCWLHLHSRFHDHFTPTGASWLNMVERFFRV